MFFSSSSGGQKITSFQMKSFCEILGFGEVIWPDSVEQFKEAINIMMQCSLKHNRWQLHRSLLYYTRRTRHSIVLNFTVSACDY